MKDETQYGALVLIRQPGEAICIGDDIRIVVESVVTEHSKRGEHTQVVLGFKAPSNVKILRMELESHGGDRRPRVAKARRKPQEV